MFRVPGGTIVGANSFMYLFVYLFFIRSFVRSYLSFLSFPLSPFSVFVFAFFSLSKKYKIRTASRLSNLALFCSWNPESWALESGQLRDVRYSKCFSKERYYYYYFLLVCFPNSSGVPIVFETDHHSVKLGSNSLARFM